MQEKRGKTSFIEGIQTGADRLFTDISVLGIHQTEYGRINGEVYLETYSYASLEEEQTIESRAPDGRMALDQIGARKLINVLSSAFKVGVQVSVQHRTVEQENARKKEEEEI